MCFRKGVDVWPGLYLLQGLETHLADLNPGLRIDFAFDGESSIVAIRWQFAFEPTFLRITLIDVYGGNILPFKGIFQDEWSFVQSYLDFSNQEGIEGETPTDDDSVTQVWGCDYAVNIVKDRSF